MTFPTDSIQQANRQHNFKYVWRSIIVPIVLFISFFVLANAAVTITCTTIVAFDCPLAWPISVFSLRVIETWDLIRLIALFIFAWLVFSWLEKHHYPISGVLPIAVVLLLSSNFIPGWLTGFVTPIAYGADNYYYDAVEIADPIEFIQGYEEAQETSLRLRTRTNPPGAALNIYLINKLVNSPGWISVVVTIITGSATALFMWLIIRQHFPDDQWLPGYVTLLLMIVPAIQIFYTFAVDPIISSALLASIYFTLHPNRYINVSGNILSLFIASFTSFLFIFVIPIMGALVLYNRKMIWRVILSFLGLLILYGLIERFIGYHYIHSFQIASAIENPDGFRLFSDTINYVATRLESIADILFFFGPFLILLSLRGIRPMLQQQSSLRLLTIVALVAFSGMLAAGVLRTGEASRVMLFIYPYLLIPVAYRLRESEYNRVLLLNLIFGQTLILQIIGIYFA